MNLSVAKIVTKVLRTPTALNIAKVSTVTGAFKGQEPSSDKKDTNFKSRRLQTSSLLPKRDETTRLGNHRPGVSLHQSKMTSEEISRSHLERTEDDFRAGDSHELRIVRTKFGSPTVKLVDFELVDKGPLPFTAGQWLDVYVPGVENPGGFTITSRPQDHMVQLAIQRSEKNPAAMFFWSKALENKQVRVRVGGSFTYPPKGWSSEDVEKVDHIVFVAGGVGINPFMSMIRFLRFWPTDPKKISILYSSKEDPVHGILFYPQLAKRARDRTNHCHISRFCLFLTGTVSVKAKRGILRKADYHTRRMNSKDILNEIENPKTLVYICGPKDMTDEFVDVVKKSGAVPEENVFCEKWW